MIKAGAKGKDGRPIVILGLSDGNLEELRQNRPIVIDLEPFGVQAQAIVIWGETEEAITQELSKHFRLPS